MTDKDKDHKEAAEKRDPARFQNRDQDPDHPANKTLSPKSDPQPRPVAEGVIVAPEEMRTEQEKDAAAGGAATAGNVPGVGPAPASEVTSGPVETIEDQGIGPRTPYPTGSPPPPSESVSYSQGIKGATDKPSAKPGSSSGPAGQAPRVGDRDKAYEVNRKQDEPQIKPRSNP